MLVNVCLNYDIYADTHSVLGSTIVDCFKKILSICMMKINS